ncbi:MAG: hypothetical protein ABTQ31_00325 [Rhizobiaceae bacterium]
MRGRSPGHCERLPVAAPSVGRGADDRAVFSDLSPDMPVTEAELDAIEAFLADALRAVMAPARAGANARNRGDFRRSDSEAPQSSGKLFRSCVLEGS